METDPKYDYRRFTSSELSYAGLKGDEAIRRYLGSRPGWEIVGYDVYSCQWVTRRKKREV